MSIRFGIILSLLTLSAFCNLAGAIALEKSSFEKILKNEVSKNYGIADIRFLSPIQWKTPGVPENVRYFSKAILFSMLNDDSKGNIHFVAKIDGKDDYFDGWVRFSAIVKARVAMKRVHPGEKLSEENFTVQDIDISNGMSREYRGVVLPITADLSKLETTQTILEGQFLVSSAVQTVPDLRRGDFVRVQLISGDLVLSTTGIAEEPGYVNRQIKVLTSKTKRELLGMLRPNGMIEVKL